MAFRSLLPTAMASIHLISVGSRGDLEPYLALLEELRRRKHQVHLIGSVNFEEACRDRDLRFTCLLYTSPSPRDKRQSRMPSSA